MLSVIQKAVRTLDRLLEGAVATIFFGMVVLIILLVILRYFFNRSIPGGYEALRFAFMYTTFLGSAVLLSRRDHIGIELLTKHLPPTIQRILDITGHSLIFVVHVYLLILSFRWIAVTGKNLAEELKIPLKFIQVSLPIGCGFTGLYSTCNIIDTIFSKKRKREDEG